MVLAEVQLLAGRLSGCVHDRGDLGCHTLVLGHHFSAALPLPGDAELLHPCLPIDGVYWNMCLLQASCSYIQAFVRGLCTETAW